MASFLSRRRLLGLGAGALLAACVPQPAARGGDGLVALYADPRKNEWPEQFLQLPAETQAMYRYAVANEATLKWFPATAAVSRPVIDRTSTATSARCSPTGGCGSTR